MKKLMMTVLLLSYFGCSSIAIPQYILDNNPYEEIYYSDFKDVLSTTEKALNALGWIVEKKSDPSVYEHDRSVDLGDVQQILLFTAVRQTSMILWTKYKRLNVYLKEEEKNVTSVECRFLNITSIPFKSFRKYQNDKYVKHLFQEIEKGLK